MNLHAMRVMLQELARIAALVSALLLALDSERETILRQIAETNGMDCGSGWVGYQPQNTAVDHR